jgi:ribokinase
MKYKYDLISIGDATIDTFLMMDENDIQIVTESGRAKMMMNWGDKLPVKALYRTVAGNAANNAVGSARLGLKTALYTVLAHDTGGREIMYKMKKEKVASDYIVADDRHGTNASTVISMNGERTILVYHEKRTYKLPDFAPARWVYLTSMATGFETIYNDLLKYIQTNQVKLGFNPGTFQLRKGVVFHKSLLRHTELLVVNKEEAQSWTTQTDDYEELCKRLFDLGPKAVVVTDGRKGAFSYSAEGFYYIPEFPGNRIEATGAGDSFATAYIAGLASGKSHGEALAWGPINAASVVLRVGPQAGLLTRAEIEAQLQKRPKYVSVLISDPKTKAKIMDLVKNKKV